jgi:hypothetical protein
VFNLPSTPWVWTPLILALVASAIAAGYAFRQGAKEQPVGESFFQGPGAANAGAVSTVLTLVPLLLSPEVRRDAPSASLLGAATLLFAVATFFGLWLYGGVAAAARKKEGDIVKVTVKPYLIAVQSVVVTFLIVGAGCFVVFVLVTPALGPSHDVAKSNSKVTILECTDDGCRRR